MFLKNILIGTIVLLACYLNAGIFAQTVPPMPTDPSEIERIILAKDSAFWSAYNSCDMAAFPAFLTEDLEFYHDKSGLEEGRSTLIRGMKEGLCGNTEYFQLRRAAIPGTVQVFPLANYGAIISGEHVFYINEKGKEEYLDGRARFTHVWRYEDGEWRMSRVLSYDHRPANRP